MLFRSFGLVDDLGICNDRFQFALLVVPCLRHLSLGFQFLALVLRLYLHLLLLLDRIIELGLTLPLQGVSLDFHNWCNPTFPDCTDVTVFRLALHIVDLLLPFPWHTLD